ncbi:MAG: pyrimidine dimer DNA glycosylase/endonuclease V [Nanoarchaeota archaeon]|nr:pyrimidine dimer DNA glycosylase/endonuclease V [Nanoarchaeota archaeon]MBU1974787.1 pyrimidine dimer DNA glycosylase/endonuclease V [Nanoarchaeota archaeon]
MIDPRRLADQHLIAEYNEILMIFGYVSKYPKLGIISTKYTLGKGHMIFFKNKLKYLKKRHELIKREMKIRGFNATKTINLAKFDKILIRDWWASEEDIKIIKERLITKINSKPRFYRYYGKIMSKKFLIDLINTQ